MTNCLPSFLVPFLIGLEIGDSHLVILFIFSLALFFFVISVFLCFAFPSFFVLLICWCYFAICSFLNIHLSYLSKKKKKIVDIDTSVYLLTRDKLKKLLVALSIHISLCLIKLYMLNNNIIVIPF